MKKIKLERELKRAAILASKDANNLFKGIKATVTQPGHGKGLRNRTEIQLDKKLDSYRNNAFKLEELKESTKVTTLVMTFLFIYEYVYMWY